MTALPSSIADLIRRLSTNFDGEVVATVRAIDRKLKAAGCDWHDLARVATAQACSAFLASRQPTSIKAIQSYLSRKSAAK
jgi:hypothetical protein